MTTSEFPALCPRAKSVFRSAPRMKVVSVKDYFTPFIGSSIGSLIELWPSSGGNAAHHRASLMVIDTMIAIKRHAQRNGGRLIEETMGKPNIALQFVRQGAADGSAG